VRRHPGIGRVQVLPKRGHYTHEMARFRYDVVLRTADAPAAPDLPWTDWREHDLSLPALERWLTEERPEALALASIPDARLAAETAALALLSGRFTGEDEGKATVQELQRVVAGRVVWDTQRGAGPVEPEDLCELAERHGYRAELTWSDPREWGGGRFSAVLRRPPACGRRPMSPEVPDLPWSACANDPLRNKLARRLVPELRRFLRDRLPEFMVPASFVVLEDLPVTPHGKVDRAALPSPDPGRPEGSGAYRAPRDPHESELAGIWCDLLGAERVGIFDNFFELGGHSLLATQVVARVRERFGVELPVRALFEEPTIAALAARIRSLSEALTALSGLQSLSGQRQTSLSAPAGRVYPLQLQEARHAVGGSVQAGSSLSQPEQVCWKEKG
jgi:acyl carrier protein